MDEGMVFDGGEQQIEYVLGDEIEYWGMTQKNPINKINNHEKYEWLSNNKPNEKNIWFMR